MPQWNCRCANCQAARAGSIPSRTQSCVAFSADGSRWFLINASPDIRSQVLALQGDCELGSRSHRFEAILLSNADLDHTLGLMIVREGGPVTTYATEEVRRTVSEALGFERILGAFSGAKGIDWRALTSEPVPLREGLTLRTILLGGSAPRYDADTPDGPGHACAFVVESPAARFVCAVDVAGRNEALMREVAGAQLTIFDGSFWSDREMIDLGFSQRTASQMGHWAIEESLPALASNKLPGSRIVYSHINNTNPILDPASPEARRVSEAGLEVGADGMEWEI